MWIQPSTRSSDLFQLRESPYLDAFPPQDAKVHRDSSPGLQELEGTLNTIWRQQPIQEEKTTSQRRTEKGYCHDSPNRRRQSQIRTRDRLSRRLGMTRGAGAGRRSYKPSSFRSLGFRCRSYTAATIDCRGEQPPSIDRRSHKNHIRQRSIHRHPPDRKHWRNRGSRLPRQGPHRRPNQH